MSWRRLGVLVEALARTPGTRLHKELVGTDRGADWTLDQHLLAAIADQLALANWQRQGKKGATRPEPISPLAKRPTNRSGNTTGQDPREVKAILAAHAGR